MVDTAPGPTCPPAGLGGCRREGRRPGRTLLLSPSLRLACPRSLVGVCGHCMRGLLRPLSRSPTAPQKLTVSQIWKLKSKVRGQQGWFLLSSLRGGGVFSLVLPLCESGSSSLVMKTAVTYGPTRVASSSLSGLLKGLFPRTVALCGTGTRTSRCVFWGDRNPRITHALHPSARGFLAPGRGGPSPGGPLSGPLPASSGASAVMSSGLLGRGGQRSRRDWLARPRAPTLRAVATLGPSWDPPFLSGLFHPDFATSQASRCRSRSWLPGLPALGGGAGEKTLFW